jgi:hypothetical protein
VKGIRGVKGKIVNIDLNKAFNMTFSNLLKWQKRKSVLSGRKKNSWKTSARCDSILFKFKNRFHLRNFCSTDIKSVIYSDTLFSYSWRSVKCRNKGLQLWKTFNCTPLLRRCQVVGGTKIRCHSVPLFWLAEVSKHQFLSRYSIHLSCVCFNNFFVS